MAKGKVGSGLYLRGVIVLTEGRSGSNWVGSLARSAKMGNAGEWLDPDQLGVSPCDVDAETYFEAALVKASADRIDFFIKIFPRHLFGLRQIYSRDFISYCLEQHQTRLVFLTRRDRLRQAISFARAVQSQQWTSHRRAIAQPRYDFDKICSAYFKIGRSYDFWKSYLDLHELEADHFVYEDLVQDPSPFLDVIAEALGKPRPARAESDLVVQRDAMTEEWVSRFREDIKAKSVRNGAMVPRPPQRTLSNLLRFVRKERMKPIPFAD